MRNRIFWLAGATIQGVAIGTLLFAAILRLGEVAAGARIFQYQGF